MCYISFCAILLVYVYIFDYATSISVVCFYSFSHFITIINFTFYQPGLYTACTSAHHFNILFHFRSYYTLFFAILLPLLKLRLLLLLILFIISVYFISSFIDKWTETHTLSYTCTQFTCCVWALWQLIALLWCLCVFVFVWCLYGSYVNSFACSSFFLFFVSSCVFFLVCFVFRFFRFCFFLCCSFRTKTHVHFELNVRPRTRT